jgi:hypothetical protein
MFIFKGYRFNRCIAGSLRIHYQLCGRTCCVSSAVGRGGNGTKPQSTKLTGVRPLLQCPLTEPWLHSVPIGTPPLATLRLLLNPEDGSSWFFWNVGNMASHPISMVTAVRTSDLASLYLIRICINQVTVLNGNLTITEKLVKIPQPYIRWCVDKTLLLHKPMRIMSLHWYTLE